MVILRKYWHHNDKNWSKTVIFCENFVRVHLKFHRPRKLKVTGAPLIWSRWSVLPDDTISGGHVLAGGGVCITLVWQSDSSVVLGWAGLGRAPRGWAGLGRGWGWTHRPRPPAPHTPWPACCGVWCDVQCAVWDVCCGVCHTTQGVRCRGCTQHQARLGAGCGPGRGQPGSSDSPGADAGAATLWNEGPHEGS